MDHLKRDHLSLYQEAMGKKEKNGESSQDAPKIADFFQKKVSISWPKTGKKWKEATDALTKWLVKDSRPSYLIESEAFRHFIQTICPEYTVPCSKTINNKIEKMYVDVKGTVKKSLEKLEFCSISTDGGSSSNSSSFHDIGVHYISDDFELKYNTLSVREVKIEHSASNYRKNTDNVCDEFGITEKIVKTVTDNEPKMNAAFEEKERGGCMAHILHKSIDNTVT